MEENVEVRASGAAQEMSQDSVEMSQPGTLFVSDLVKEYGGRKVVNGLSLYVKPGEIVGLLGPNGAGKTTAFYMITGLIRPDAGSVVFSGQDITYMPMHERAKLGLGYLAQEPSVFKELTVEENLLTVLETRVYAHLEQQMALESLLKELELTPLRKKKAQTLSGGERRRLEITRALATEPLCLMLDEPFANVDPIAIADLRTIIRRLSAKGIGILITDHNAREIFSVVQRSYLVSEGRVLLSGTVDELIHHEEARKKYFGHDFSM